MSGLILTTAGAAAIEAAYQAGTVVKITLAAFGDGGGKPITPNPGATALVNKFGDAPFTGGASTEGMISGQTVIEARKYPGKILREVGLVSADGVLVAYGDYPDTVLPADGAPVMKEIIINFVMTLTHAESVVIEVDPNVSALTISEADKRYVKKAGDTMIGPLTTPYVASTPDVMPEGAGAYGDQLSSKAPFYQPNWQWDVTSGGVFVPVAKGTSTRKGKGWPTAVSFGYLMPGTDMHAHPVIHALGDSGMECIWEFDTQTGGLRSKAGTFAIQEQQPIVPLPFSGDTPPPNHVFMVGQSFDKNIYKRTAQAFPSGVFPDMRGLTIIGKTDDRSVLSWVEGQVKSHTHGGEVMGANLGAKETTANGAYQLKLRSYRSNTSLDGGDSSRHSIDQDRGFTDYGLIEALPNHTHWIDLGWHGHGLRIDAFGAAKNTVDNIAFNYIVRLA
ncbi:phage tail protein [Serratia ureilytica]|uniref:phage tail-collar fiber domain-containing protein n=1 Tax=Serratia ureilytica TaxID=300181 RepID=UPI00313D0926